VDEGAARSVATTIIRPCGLLGYLVGRGAWWPNEARLKQGRRAVGQVMGSAYHLLNPVWQAYPSTPDESQIHLVWPRRARPFRTGPRISGHF
jgi:hypothetical protein